MFFDPEKVPGVGELILIDIEQNKTVHGEFDKLFEDMEGLSRIFLLYSPNFQMPIEYGIYMVFLIQVTLFI